MNHLNCQRSKW